ncbi:midcut-by-XrtH protein [Acidovorax sp. NCPPB 3859]|nr:MULTISPECIES: midcut-by-XrtH protein [unclassified Acidovorax]MDA8451285.1 midcut-by-XrtH protein [Acidovorax sp. GBBC 3297]MDA8460730.1 midcut-by-XrtH protein [Acidovorax sp. GBBC 3333]MDA8465765.1 midcut-by-XrtH protein [Acidovorax sp. GBBC 3332]MDA8470747.1 midcut-by-XrtH protein [Acidovorax sp. GBBC 3299]WCM79196.1 midcut-by-XrtH protein [Acidovorax sp. GBBC 712]
MKKIFSSIRAAGRFAMFGALAYATSAMAEPAIEVVYSPNIAASGSQPIPTLSQWGVVLLSLAVVVVMYRSLRKARGGRPIAGLLLAGGLAIAMGGSGLVGKSFAAIDSLNLSDPAGGSVFPSLGETKFVNTSGVTQQIKQISAPQPTYVVLTPSNTPQCQVGTVLSPGSSCFLRFSEGT